MPKMLRAILQKVETFLLKGWLIEAIFLTCLSITITLTVTYVADSVYKVSIGSVAFKTGNLTMASSNGSTSNPASNTTNSTTTGNTQSPSASSTSTNQPSTTGTTQTPAASSPNSTAPTTNNPTPAPTPTPTPTPTPPPAPSGCFVTVNGYLYNMQPAVGKTLTDPNTSKQRLHSSSTFQCGSFSSPTNMTSVYLSKHSGMGCAARLAPYIYTPPAPLDPTC